MLSFENQLQIAAVHLTRLKKEIRESNAWEIDDLCRTHRDFWKCLNSTNGKPGSVDEILSECIDSTLVVCDATVATLHHTALVKAISILVSLFDCLSDKAPLSKWSIRCFDLLRHTLKAITGTKIWKTAENVNEHYSSDHLLSPEEKVPKELSRSTQTSDALESWYEILEILTVDLCPRLSLDRELISMDGDYTIGILALLDQAATMGRTKVVAKISSTLFEKMLDWTPQKNPGFLAKEMLRVLQDKAEPKECTTEGRCVGVHCLVKTLTEFIKLQYDFYASTNVDYPRSVSAEWDTFLEGDSQLVNAVHRYLISDKVFVRKCGRSIVSMILGHLQERCESLDLFTDFIKMMEALELKQLHVVKPAFGLLDTLVSHCQGMVPFAEPASMKRFDVTWLRLIFYNALNHMNAYVVKWAIGKYFEIDSGRFRTMAGDLECEFLFDVVLPVLDRSDAYYRFSEEGSLHDFLQNLERFVRGVIQAWNPVIFWRKWLKVMKEYRRAPVGLCYLSHVLSMISDDHDRSFSIFDYDDLESFRSVFWEFRQVPLPFIRAAIQESNVNILLNLCNWNESTMLKACSKVLSVIPARLIRPESARHFVDQRNGFAWLSDDFMSTTLLRVACSIVDQADENKTVDSISWTVEGLRALIVMLNSASKSHVTSVAWSLARKLSAILTDTSYEAMDFQKLNGQILLFTTWIEQDPNIFRPIVEDVSTLSCLISDAIQWRICCEDMDVTELTVFTGFYRTIFSSSVSLKLLTCVEEILKRLQMSYSNCGVGDLRRYFILKISAQLLEEAPGPIVRDVRSVFDFIASLILDNTDNLRNTGRRFDPLEWNRIISEYNASKWRCLASVVKVAEEEKIRDLNWARVAHCALEALDIVSGAEEIQCVINCTQFILRQVPPEEYLLVAKIVKKLFVTSYEQRKSEQFVPTVRCSCLAILQPTLIFSEYSAVLKELENIVHRFISETENPSLACCVSEAINNALSEPINPNSRDGALEAGETLLLNALVELCCFGNLLRKDQRMVYDVSEVIKEFGSRGMYQCTQLYESDHIASQKTRLYAFHSVLTLLEKSSDQKRAQFVDYLVELACGKLLELVCGATKNGYFANSQCHRVRTRAVQLLLLLEQFMIDHSSAIRLQEFTVRYLAEQNQQPSVRLLLEWLMTRINLRFRADGLLDKWWAAEAYMTEKRVGTLCTWMEVLMHTGLCLPPDERRRHTLECVKRWLPWCTAQNFTLRCCAQTCLRRMWTEEQKRRDGSTVDQTWDFLVNFLNPTVMFDKEQRNNTKNVEMASRDFYFSVFNAERDYTLQTIFHVFPRLCFLPVDELIPVDMWRIFGPTGSFIHLIPIENSSDELAKGNVFVWRDRAQEALAEEIGHVASYESLQTKTNLFTGESDVFMEEMRDGLRRSENSSNRDGLIVSATLVDRPTNLGGLCRTCEIFGATEYAVSTYRVAEDSQFQALSVSSERWVKMVEVKLADLMTYLKQKQSDGYTVVAVEQTTTSHQLTEYKFPVKTLLLLGNEKEGIPVDLLQCVDVCVEIPQLGHTRSLNVHVAGALLIWEYTKQTRFMK